MTLVPTMAGRRWPADRGFCESFAATCAEWPERVGIVDGERSLTFAEWDRRSADLATALRSMGVGAGDVVAFQLPNWWETAVVFTACARLGAVANPLLTIFREREVAFMLRQSGARHLFVPGVFRGFDYPAMVERVRSAGTAIDNLVVVRGGDSTVSWDEGDAREPCHSASPHDVLLLMYTSGTTALPKGVLHTHASLMAEVSSLARVHGLAAGDATLMPSPLTHISGTLHGILTPAVLATRAVLMDRWDAQQAVDMVRRHGITYMVGAPVFLRELVDAHGSGPPLRLRLFSCGGADVAPELIRRARQTLGCTAKRVYGSTEFPTISTTTPEDVDTLGILTEGRPIEPNRVRIVSADGRALPPGEEGEIQALGPECFVGYVDAAMNEDAFTDDGWFRTGDLGTLDEGGYLTVTGRIKEILIRKGEKISIREVEEAVRSHPRVLDACVVGIADAAVGERAGVAVVLASGTPISLAEISAHLARVGLARQKHPERLVIAEALARTESGKVRRQDVLAMFARQAGSDES